MTPVRNRSASLDQTSIKMTWKSLFIILAITLATVQGKPMSNTKNMDKRHIATSFSNNPFFLSHFEDREHHFTYGPPQTYSDWDEDWSEEDEEPTFLFPVEAIDDPEEPSIFKEPTIKLNQNTDETLHEIEEDSLYIFKSLPYFERFYNFKPTAVSVEKIEETGGDHQVYVFKSLPHYEISTDFNSQLFPGVVKNEETSVLVENPSSEIRQTGGELYFFSSLPLYDISQPFRSDILDESSIRKIEEIPTIIANPLHKMPQVVKETLFTEVSNIKKEDNLVKSNGETYFFNLLPFYELAHPFRNTKLIPSTFVEVQQAKNEEKLNFLPFFEVSKKFQHSTIQHEVKTETNDRKQTEIFTFNSLPTFDANTQFKKQLVNDLLPTEEFMKVPEEYNSRNFFKTLPKFDTHSQFSAHKIKETISSPKVVILQETTTLKQEMEKLEAPVKKSEEKVEYFFNILPSFDTPNEFKTVPNEVNKPKPDFLFPEEFTSKVKVEESTKNAANGVRVVYKTIEENVEYSPENIEKNTVKTVPIVNEVKKPIKTRLRKVLKLVRKKPAATIEEIETVPDNLEHNIQFLAPHQSKLLKNPEEDVSEYFENGFGKKLQPIKGIELIPLQDNVSTNKIFNSYGQAL